MLATTASAPDISRSPITTLDLMGVWTVGHHPSHILRPLTHTSRRSKPLPFQYHSHLLRGVLSARSSTQPGPRHAPVSTTTFPFARSAYAKSSSSEMTVVMVGQLRVKVGSRVKQQSSSGGLGVPICTARSPPSAVDARLSYYILMESHKRDLLIGNYCSSLSPDLKVSIPCTEIGIVEWCVCCRIQSQGGCSFVSVKKLPNRSPSRPAGPVGLVSVSVFDTALSPIPFSLDSNISQRSSIERTIVH